ncbi:ABC-F family ATP-binding cassette domain-containing protein [Aggregatilinea lenta]|uniref:ABC-F family ATP-binding cassette domain-containing protein n=1 Tax=Aggregatilinea lenta TaxID=913108 RepID=UPI000E5BA7EF|nr:ABC-F family ATP-binding cassette domain-containing protein [Aggregatilinea lenta]
MALLSATNVAKSFGANDIFSGVTVDIPHGAKIAMVGPNGAGKTTLLHVLMKAEEPSEGIVTHMKGLSIGYLPQRPDMSGERTLWDEMMTAFTALREREAKLHVLAESMGEASGDELDAIMERYGQLEHQFEDDGGYMYETRTRQVLQGLGFDAGDYGMPLAHLSGGQQTRALLARLLLESPDLLVMDEPTNHLDINAVEWLESFLKTWPGALLVVSHDRYFMDSVVTTIWEMDWGTVEAYRGNYSHYQLQRADRHERLLREYEAQQEFIAKEEDYIRRNIAGQNTAQAKGRLRRLERLKRDSLVARPRTEQQIRIKLKAQLRSGDKVLMTYGLQAGYERDHPLVTVPDITLYRGEIAAIIGPNGVGKTTLLKTLLHDLPPLKGSVRLGAAVEPGYFAQAHEGLNPNRSVLDELLTVRDLPLSEARSYLATFLFTGDDVFQPIRTLSGGERGRLALAKLSLAGANFLLLDEPTNHLDIPSQEILQSVMAAFDGTILLVSHDRYLIDALATQVWDVQPDGMTVFEGNYREYVEAREAARQAVREEKATPARAGAAARKNGKSDSERARRLAQVEATIHELETQLAALESDAGRASQAGEVDRVRELGEAYTAVQADLDAALSEWETLLG